MTDDLKQKTRDTAKLYFDGVSGERVYDLWRAFDPGLARELSMFVTGQLYSREKIPHPTRQLTVVAALTVLERLDELRVHIWAAFNVGCTAEEIAEVIFQMFTYGGAPVVNQALLVLRDVMTERGLTPAGTAAREA